MKHILLSVAAVVCLAACSRGASQAPVAACAVNQSNRCSCGGSTEGLQVCLPTQVAYGACVCSDACADGGDCVATPALIGMDMDQTGDAVTAANLLLPDTAALDGGFTFVDQVNDPPVQVLDQVPAAGVPVKRGTQMQLTVTLPPNQESLGLPNSHFLVGALNQDTDISAQAYYDTIDPGPLPKRATLDDWKDANGFNSGLPADLEAVGTYVSHADLGFGRRMHVRKTGKRVAFYVDNYLTGGDAVIGSNYFATVTMEWSPGPNGQETDPYFTQFYVYNKKGDRIIDPKLDDHGPKNNPSVCLSCHGSNNTDFTYQSNGGNIGAKFIPFDLDNLKFPAGAERSKQEAAFKTLNEAVYATWDRNDPAYAGEVPPVIDMIDSYYGGPGHPSPTFIGDTVLPGWDTSQQGHDLYSKVFGKSCVGCHAQREPFRNFSTFTKFNNEKALVATRVFEQGVMPLSEKGSRNFWASYPSQPKILAAFLGVPFKSPGTPTAHITVTHPGNFLTAGTTVTLSGQTSQYGSKYIWTQTGGPAVALLPAASDNSIMTFVAPAGGGALTFQLMVSLGAANSAPDTAIIGVQGSPSAPTNVIATAGLSSATVTWTQGDNGGDIIQHSTITATPGNIVTQVTGAGSSAVVTGLTPGVTYSFTVVSTNEIGDSGVSAHSNSVTAFSTPGAPINVAAVRGNTQVSLSWNPPSNTGGAPILAYEITGTPSPSTPISVAANGVGLQSTVISGLVNGVSYVFDVVADNGGRSSPAASPAVVPDVQPNAPSGVNAAQTGANSASVTWTAPAPNGGTSVTGYQVTAVSAVDGSGPSISVPSSPLAASVSGLSANTTYTFVVEARNGAGLSTNSQASGAVFMATTVGAPSPPNTVAASFDVNGAAPGEMATVTWAAPDNTGNSPINNYEIIANPGPGGVTPSPQFVNASTFTFNVTGLTGGVNYTFTVAAVNTQGTGPGANSNSVAVQGRPQAATGLGLTAFAGAAGGSGSITASWSAPTNTGGSPITNYTAVFGSSSVSAGTGLAVNSGALPTRCISYATHVNATNKWGTTSTGNVSRVNGVAPSAVGGQSISSPSAAHLSVSWSAVAETGCNVTYSVNSNPANILNTTTAGTSFTNLTAPSCNYATNGTDRCGQTWSFTIQASNSLGFGGAATTGAVRPLVSYASDNVNAIWDSNPHVQCTGCHFSGSGFALLLDNSNGATNRSNILGFTSTSASTSEIIQCPLGNCNSQQGITCPTMNSGKYFVPPAGQGTFAETTVISQWISDGRLP